jgi:hypothetical protein
MVRTAEEAAADTEPLRETIIDLTKTGPVITELIAVQIIEIIPQGTIQEAIKDQLRLPQGHIHLLAPEAGLQG